MFLGCRGEANRPIAAPSNWRSPVINFTLVSVHVSPLPLFLSNFAVHQRISSLPVCLHRCLLNNGPTERRVENKRERSEGLWLSD